MAAVSVREDKISHTVAEEADEMAFHLVMEVERMRVMVVLEHQSYHHRLLESSLKESQALSRYHSNRF